MLTNPESVDQPGTFLRIAFFGRRYFGFRRPVLSDNFMLKKVKDVVRTEKAENQQNNLTFLKLNLNCKTEIIRASLSQGSFLLLMLNC